MTTTIDRKEFQEAYKQARIQGELNGFSGEELTVFTSAVTLANLFFSKKPRQEWAISFPVVFAEWAQDYVLKTHYDKVLAIMLYCMETEGQEQFTTSDIAFMYDKARWKKPANLADTLSKGAERIYFTEAGENEDSNKLWMLTQTGYTHLQTIKIEV